MFPKKPLPLLKRFIINVLKCGPIPKHIALIIDGNRRWSKKNNKILFDGYEKCYRKLFKCLQWCMELEIAEITVYALSVENFRRSQQEVSHKFSEYLDRLTRSEN